MQQVRKASGALAIAAALLGAPVAAHAHPHILATLTTGLSQPAADRTALRFLWTMDAGFTAYTMAEQKIMQFDAPTLARLAKTQSEALAEFGHFSKISVNGKPGAVTVSDPAMTLTPEGTLAFGFTMSVEHAGEKLKVLDAEIFDANFFAYFSLDPKAPVTIEAAAKTCRAETNGPAMINLKETRSVPKAFWAALDGSVSDQQKFVNRIRIECE